MTQSLLQEHNKTELMLALEVVFERIYNLKEFRIKDFWNPAKCPKNLLPYLAGQLGVDFWSEEFNEEYQRRICEKALQINNYRGTIGSLKLVVEALGMGLEVIEWFQYPEGDPNRVAGTGKIILHLGENTWGAEEFEIIKEAVTKVKRLSFHIAVETENTLSQILPYLAGGGMDGDIFNMTMEGV